MKTVRTEKIIKKIGRREIGPVKQGAVLQGQWYVHVINILAWVQVITAERSRAVAPKLFEVGDQSLNGKLSVTLISSIKSYIIFFLLCVTTD